MNLTLRVPQHWQLLTFLLLCIPLLALYHSLYLKLNIIHHQIQLNQEISLYIQFCIRINNQNCFEEIVAKKKREMKNTGYNAQQIKNEIQNLNMTRESIQKSKDVSGAMVKLSQTMNTLKPLMSKQSQYIKTFLQTQSTSSTSSQQSQLRRYANRIFDISVNQITQLILLGQNYFTIEVKQSWNKMAVEIQKAMTVQKEKIQTANPTRVIDYLFKVMNIKEKLFREFLRSIIYRKLLLCKDINIQQEGYVHSEKKSLNKLIETYQIEKSYVPPKPFFEQLDFMKDGTEGVWSLTTLEGEKASISEIFKIATIEIEQIFGIVRNYANLNEQQRNKEEIKRNDQQVISLREKIDLLQKNYQILQKKYRQAISKDEKLDLMELREKLKQAQDDLQAKDHEIKKLNYQFRDSSTQMQSLKEKVTELTSDLEKLTKQELIKLKDLQNVQKNLGLQFTRIYQSIKSFGNIFQFQSQGKKSLAKQILANKSAIQKMASMLCRQKQRNKQLKSQMTRLNEIILQLGTRIKLKRMQEYSFN